MNLGGARVTHDFVYYYITLLSVKKQVLLYSALSVTKNLMMVGQSRMVEGRRLTTTYVG